MCEMVKSLPCMFFKNTTNLLNFRKFDNIVSEMQNDLWKAIEGIFDEIINTLAEKSVLNGIRVNRLEEAMKFYNRQSYLIDKVPALLSILEILNSQVESLSCIYIKEFEEYKKSFLSDENSTKTLCSAAMVKNYRNCKKYTCFSNEFIDSIVICFLIPEIKKKDRYQIILNFIKNTDKFFEIKEGNKILKYNYTKYEYASLKKDVDNYVMNIKDDPELDNFRDLLIGIFKKLENITVEKSIVGLSDSNDDDRETIKDRANKEIGDFLHEQIKIPVGTSGLVEEQISDFFLNTTAQILNDYFFIHDRYHIPWNKCRDYNGFRSLMYYRLYNNLCAFDNDYCLNRSKELFDRCCRETHIYLHPLAEIAAPTFVGQDVFVTSGCKINSCVTIANGTKIITDNKLLSRKGKHTRPIIIDNDVIIMEDCLIHGKTHIGSKVIIESGLVIDSDIDGFTHVKNPPDKIKQIDYDNFVEKISRILIGG